MMFDPLLRRYVRLVLLGLLPFLAACHAPPPLSVLPAAPPVIVSPQKNWQDAIIYFVLVDRFADGDPTNNRNVDRRGKGTFHGGDLKGITGQLDELADLGVTAIWINPVVKNIDHYVDGVGFPDWGYHGYWADDFNRLDDRFGTEADLKNLVDAAHLRGIKVLLDVVYNHCGYGAAYLKQSNADAWLRTGRHTSPCGDDDLTQCLAGLPDFKTENPVVADYLMTAHLGLAKRVGLDGFRLDTVKHVDHDFWQAHRVRIDQELHPDFFLLGEVWGGDKQVLDPWFENDELDGGFDFSFKGSVQGFVQGRGRTIAFSRYLMKRHKVREGYLLSHYLSSHDVPGALYQLNGNKTLYKLCVALQMTSIGVPMIYYGEEVARLGGDWPDNRSDMPWGDRNILPGRDKPRDEEMRAYFRKLIRLRRTHSALWQGNYEEISTEGNLLIFGRHDVQSGDTVVVAINRGNEKIDRQIQLPTGWKGRTVRDGLTGRTMDSFQGRLSISVGARTALVLEAG